MNNWPIEFAAECHRRRILEEVAQIRLEKLAAASAISGPPRLARLMVRFADWMIFAGRRLRARYEASCHALPASAVMDAGILSAKE